jgi:hypothetical protein
VVRGCRHHSMHHMPRPDHRRAERPGVPDGAHLSGTRRRRWLPGFGGAVSQLSGGRCSASGNLVVSAGGTWAGQLGRQLRRAWQRDLRLRIGVGLGRQSSWLCAVDAAASEGDDSRQRPPDRRRLGRRRNRATRPHPRSSRWLNRPARQRAAAGPARPWQEVGLIDGFEDDLHRRLHHPVTNRRDRDFILRSSPCGVRL